jgi:hypothetical protein
MARQPTRPARRRLRHRTRKSCTTSIARCGTPSPAQGWSSEALPIGNGRMGAMLFGGVNCERIQFNENSLWSGDNNWDGDYECGDHGFGSYRNFGDLFVEFGNPSEVRATSPSEQVKGDGKLRRRVRRSAGGLPPQAGHLYRASTARHSPKTASPSPARPSPADRTRSWCSITRRQTTAGRPARFPGDCVWLPASHAKTSPMPRDYHGTP